MIIIRKAQQRGNSQTGWLNSYHTFSFADYYDPKYMGFSSLRVINEDTVQPAMGFGRHSHNNMEIISYVVDGALEHKDSLGTGSTIRPGEIQRMSAGTGIQHSEFNHSDSELLHFLQIWIIPEKDGLTPGYEQKKIPTISNQLILIGAKEQHHDAILIHQDVKLYVAYLGKGNSLSHEFKPHRRGWLQLVKGKITLNGQELTAGDGAAITQEAIINIDGIENAELLLFELPEVD